MPNLEFVSNVVHQGIFLKKGMIVDDQQSGLADVAQNLIERGLARGTEASATHTAALVSGGGEALPLSATAGGQVPNAVGDEARKAAAEAAQVPADQQTVNAVEDQANKEAETVNRGSLLDRAKTAIGVQAPPQVQ